MTKDEAMKLAIEALEWSWGGEPMGTKEIEAMSALRQALDQPERSLASTEGAIMTTKTDGGQAFPRSGFSGPGGFGKPDYGMTLRDYFAAKAMQAIIIGNDADECALGLGAAKDAYAMADHMLAQREDK